MAPSDTSSEPAGCSTASPEPHPPDGTRVLTRPLLALLVATVGAFTGFFLLLSVLPLYAASGGASDFGAGLVTGALMVTTVVAQPQVPRLVARFGYRPVYVAGLVLLGLPALALPVSSALPALVAVSLVRGLGFGIVTVVGSALVAELVPANRRGVAIGLYGTAVSLPGITGLSAGVWFAQNAGFGAVFVAAAAGPLLGIAAALGIGATRPVTDGRRRGVLATLRRGELARPFLLLICFALASGVVVTFVPLTLTQRPGLASLALLTQASAVAGARWVAGVVNDRYGAAHLLAPAVLAASLGVFAAVRADEPWVLVGGMVLFGCGFGTMQNATMVLLFNRVSPAAYGTASAQWNLAYDAGTGLGATVIGLVVEQAGYDIAFAATAILVLATLAAVYWDRTAASTTR